MREGNMTTHQPKCYQTAKVSTPLYEVIARNNLHSTAMTLSDS